jgi:Tol biopolymer transport system component
MIRRLRLTLIAVVAVTGALAPPAYATFEGRNGKIAFAGTAAGNLANLDIYTIDPDGSGRTQLTTSLASDRQPAWSPDGTKIAFVSRRDGNSEIYLMSGDGANQSRLTNHPAGDTYPAWSPDGTQIVFSSTRDGDRELYAMNVDGSGQTRRLTNLAGPDDQARWSPEGTRILFMHFDPASSSVSIRTIRSDGTKMKQLTANDLHAAMGDWAPDDDRIVFVNNFCPCPASDVFAMNGAGRKIRQLTSAFGNNLSPRWSPDGRRIAFVHEDPPFGFGSQDIYTMKADGSAFFNLTNSPEFEVEPDWGCASDCEVEGERH